MSAYNPPSANLPIFDSKAFTDENTNEFLEFPTAQGIENFPSGLIGNLSGNATSASNLTTTATTQTTQHFINFSDSSATGTGSVQKVAGLSVFPNGTTYQGNTYAGAALLCPTHIGNTFTSFLSNNLTLSTNASGQDIKLNTGSNNIATISNTGLAMSSGKTISGGLAGGVAGAIVFQSGVGATSFTNAGTSGQSLLSNGSGTPTWGTPASATTATTATTATHLANGGPGQIPYNTGAGATTFLAAGSVGQTLISNGTGNPFWSKTFASPTGVNTHNGIVSGGQYQITTADINKINTFSGQTGPIVVFLHTTGFNDGDSVIIVNRSTVGSLSVYNGVGSQELNRLIVIPAIAATTSTVCNIGMTFIWSSAAGLWFSLGGFS